ATPALGAARRIEPLVERLEDLVQPLAQCTLGLRPGTCADAAAEVAALRFDFLERRRSSLRAGEPRLELVAQCGGRLRRGLRLGRALGAKLEHRFERARQDGVESLP